jgi:hypothetical protein
MTPVPALPGPSSSSARWQHCTQTQKNASPGRSCLSAAEPLCHQEVVTQL